ncbi:lipoteichoic acid biosynthesis MFS flippase LtaA [Macrococcus bovicus]|uniref:lipoteichoic acid biosynthesis MFS flippase LtaA n=1 Tax=Macrococcus bovicus TaxID=69968 RepID=UPI0025A5F89B|nr:MFS transporter [Macrococcus bovicus]WJP98456.1 MFS transporter [Macrococcus bovicus]
MRESLRGNMRGSDFSKMLVILFLMEFARGMFILSYLPILPTTALGISVGVTSICISLHFISDALMNFSTGFLLRRFGTKKVLNLCFMLAVASLSLIVVSHQVIVYFLAAILLGVAVCPIWVVMLSSVNECARAKQMGYVYFAWLVGMLAGMVSMNLIFKVHPTRYTFLMALVAFISWILYFFVETEVSYIEKKTLKAQLKLIKQVMTRHLVLFPGIVFQGIAIGMLVPILPSYAVRHLHVTTLEYTYLLIAGGAGCTIAMLFISKIMDHMPRVVSHIIIIAGFLVFGISIFVLSQLHLFILALMIGLVIGLFYGMLLPGWNTFVAEHVHEEQKEESWGVFNSLQGIGTMIGPVIGGFVAEIARNVNTTLYVSACIFALLALFYSAFFLNQHRTQKKESL